MEMKNLTIADIANALNLSRSTIDRVLNGRGNVAPETAKRVLQYAKDSRYKPNRAAKHLAKRTNCNIGVSYYLPSDFASQINQGITAVYEELNDYGLNLIIKAAESPEQQVKQIEEMKGKVDALALVAWESYLLYELVSELISDGMPVITFNRDLPSSKRLLYIGCNYFESGRLCADLLSKIASKPGKIAIINNQDIIGTYRVEGFKTVMAKHPAFKIIGPYQICESFEVKGSLNDKAIDDIQNIIKYNPDLMALYVANQTLYAAGKAVESLGKKGEIKIIGFDLYEQIIPLIEKDIIQAVVCQEPFNQGYYPIKFLFELLAEGKEIAKNEYITKLEIVIKENMRYYSNYTR